MVHFCAARVILLPLRLRESAGGGGQGDGGNSQDFDDAVHETLPSVERLTDSAAVLPITARIGQELTVVV